MPKSRIVASVIAVALAVSATGFSGAASAAEPRPAATTTSSGVRMLKNIGTGKQTPYGIGFGTRDDVAKVGNIVLFAATDSTHGTELWRTDGTTKGTKLVKDIYRDPASDFPPSSSPTGLTTIGKYVFFTADFPNRKKGIVRTDGTSAGTKLVQIIDGGILSSRAGGFTPAGKAMYFVETTNEFGAELWRTNGTSAGTKMVVDINPGSDAGIQSPLFTFDGALYFSANDGVNGAELWVSRGTEESTHMVTNLEPGFQGSSPRDFAVLDGRLFVLAYTSALGYSLYEVINESLELVADTVPGDETSRANHLTAAGDHLYFQDTTPATGSELWASDGTTVGTALVGEIRAGADSSEPDGLYAFMGDVYFRAYNGERSNLYRSDGPSTVRQIGLNLPTATASNPAIFVGCGSKLFFSAADEREGAELWATTGASSAVKRFVVRPGDEGSTPEPLVCFKNRLLFAGTSGTLGREMWFTKDP